MEWKKLSIVTPDEALSLLRTSQSGLSEAEAKRRILEYGKNSIQEPESFFWRIMQKKFRGALSWIFLAAALGTFFLGSILEALCVLGFLGISIAIELYQEFHSRKATRLLQSYLAPNSLVRREGVLKEIPSHLLVPGDIVILKKGDTLPADIRFLSGKNIATKEIHIASARERVEKQSASLALAPLSIADAANIGFAGTCLIEGEGEALVMATGDKTALGAIAFGSAHKDKETSFEKNIFLFSQFLVKVLLFGLLVVFFLYFLIHGKSVDAGDMIIFTLVLAVTIIPEALPALTALTLARGSERLAKKDIVVKRLSAIEDLGSIEILCLDKTGVLTENKLQVHSILENEPGRAVPLALLAARHDPQAEEDLQDEFDIALWHSADQKVQEAVQKATRRKRSDFNFETRLHGVTIEEGKKHLFVLRGSPEEVFRRLENVDAFTRARCQEWIREAGFRGERVLAVSYKEVDEGRYTFHGEGGFTFGGLISFLDPIKPKVADTLVLAQNLGVGIKIFSGDSKEVVGAVAYSAGLIRERTEVMTGDTFERCSLPEQLHVLETYKAFARFSPMQKKLAIHILQKSHHVGFLGNGAVEQAVLQESDTALVSMDAGDIAREASDILLVKKDLTVILEGIKESRKVFANILKYVKITLASNFGNFYSITLAALFLPFLPLLPLQILLLNLLTDIPMLAIAADRVDQEKLEKPKDQNIHAIVVTAAIFGMISSFFDLTIFKIFSEYSAGIVQTTWFLFSIITEVLLLYSLRSRRWFFQAERPTRTIILFSVMTILIALVLPYFSLGAFFGFEKLSLQMWTLIVALAFTYFVVTEIIKRWYYLHSALFTHGKK